jgi:hypothetical protein
MTFGPGAPGPEGQLEDAWTFTVPHRTPTSLDGLFIARRGLACTYFCHSIGSVQNQGQR